MFAHHLRQKLLKDLSDYTESLGTYIGTERRQAFLDELRKNSIYGEALYTITDLKEETFAGPDKPENGNPIEHIDPYVREWYDALFIAAVLVLSDGGVDNMKYHININFPMRIPPNGETRLVRSISMPCDYDEGNQLVTIFQIYQIAHKLGIYERPPVAIEVRGGGPEEVQRIRGKIRLKLLSHFPNSLPLTPIQTQLISVIRDLEKAGQLIGDETIAEELCKRGYTTKARTVNHNLSIFNRRLLEVKDGKDYNNAASRFFGFKHKSLHVIDWFEKSGIIDLLENCGKEININGGDDLWTRTDSKDT
jgi:hypothetical protein